MGIAFGVGRTAGMPEPDNSSYDATITNQVPDNGTYEFSTYSVTPDVGGLGGYIGSDTIMDDSSPYSTQTTYRNPSYPVRSLELDYFPAGADAVIKAYMNWSIDATITQRHVYCRSNQTSNPPWYDDTETSNAGVNVGLMGVNVNNGVRSYTLITSTNLYGASYGVNHSYDATEFVKAYLNSRSNGYDGYLLFPQIEGFTQGVGYDASRDFLLQMYKNTCKKTLTRDSYGAIVGDMYFKHCYFSPITGSGGVIQVDTSKISLPNEYRYHLNFVPAGIR